MRTALLWTLMFLIAAVGSVSPALAETVAMQTELKRVGCYAGKIDGRWGGESRRAMARFARLTKLDVASAKPSYEGLAALRARKGRVCSLPTRRSTAIKRERRVKRAAVYPKARVRKPGRLVRRMRMRLPTCNRWSINDIDGGTRCENRI